MAKKKKEEVVEKTTKETKVNEPKGDVTKIKEKMKMKPLVVEETITKVDLSKPPKKEEDAVQERKTEEVPVGESSKDSEEVGGGKLATEEIKEEAKIEETPIVEEITNETDQIVEKVEQAIEVAQQTGIELPEGIQKVVDFMEDTGGDLNDYVKLNQDYSKMDNQTLLEEYYQQTKPHLSNEEIEFLMEDQFSYDEEVDETRDVKRKKLALKEQVANAKTHLEENKSKYYEEIKSGSKLTKEQQEAINFYNEQKGVAKSNEAISNDFINKTNKLFNDQFKGFEYNIGDKRFRYNINDVNKVKETQKDINEFIGKFLDEKGNMAKESEYHKSLFTAMNPDAVANHFYEQGRADAMKNSVAESKNINMAPRQELSSNVDMGGVKVRALSDNTPDFKFKIKQK
jgi:hypothetical protein